MFSMKSNEINIGANIARLRKQQGLTQAQLAEKLYVSNKTVSKWERGAGYPEITQLVGISRTLGTSIENLIMSEKYGITVAGNILTDNVKIIDTYPQKGMLSNISSISQAVGGCAPNTAIDIAKLDKKIKVSVCGCVGNDDGGRYVINEMKKHGIDISEISVLDDKCTSFSDVMSIKSTGERTFFHHAGANTEFSPECINVSSLSCRMFHIGYILLLEKFDMPDPEYGTVMARFLKSVQEAGILTSIDVVSSSSGLFAEKVIPALRYTDNAVMNEIEGSGISGIPARDENGKLITENIKKTMEIIMSKGVSRRVVIHCPEYGFCLNKDGTFTAVPSLVLEKGYIKGTVGAGDAFCAGCLMAIYNGYDDKKMLEFAAGAAACSLASEDSVSGMRDKEYIFDFIEKHRERNI